MEKIIGQNLFVLISALVIYYGAFTNFASWPLTAIPLLKIGERRWVDIVPIYNPII